MFYNCAIQRDFPSQCCRPKRVLSNASAEHDKLGSIARLMHAVEHHFENLILIHPACSAGALRIAWYHPHQ